MEEGPRPRSRATLWRGCLTQAGVGPPLAQAGRLHQEHARLVRHPGAEDQEQRPQDDAALRGETGTHVHSSRCSSEALAPHTELMSTLFTRRPRSIPVSCRTRHFLAPKGPFPRCGGRVPRPGTKLHAQTTEAPSPSQSPPQVFMDSWVLPTNTPLFSAYALCAPSLAT